MAKKVLITAHLPGNVEHKLRQSGLEVLRKPLLEFNDQELEQAQGLLCLLSDQLDKQLIDRMPRLQIIANYAVGYNNIDVSYAQKKGIVVTNTPDVLTAATADLTWALILSVSRRVLEGDALVRSGGFKGWQPQLLLGSEISGKTLGIICAGRIGQAVAERAKGFRMNILYTARTQKRALEQSTGARKVELDTLLAESDFISVHCPLTPATRHLLDGEKLKKIKRGAYLINTARGAVIDEQALVAVLKSAHLAGAGLDVYEFEPAIHPQLLEMKNVVLLPHLGSATMETRTKMAHMAADNIIAVLKGKPALNPVEG